MKINHKYYILLILSIITLMVSISGFIFIRKTIYVKAIKSSKVVKEIEQIEQRRKHETSVAKIYDETSAQRDRLMSFVVHKDEVVDLIESIEKIGVDTSTELELSGIANQEVSKDNKMSNFQSHITAKGTWANIMRTLTLIENMPYGVSVDNVRLIKSGDAKSKDWELSLDVRVLTDK